MNDIGKLRSLWRIDDPKLVEPSQRGEAIIINKLCDEIEELRKVAAATTETVLGALPSKNTDTVEINKTALIELGMIFFETGYWPAFHGEKENNDIKRHSERT